MVSAIVTNVLRPRGESVGQERERDPHQQLLAVQLRPG